MMGLQRRQGAGVELGHQLGQVEAAAGATCRRLRRSPSLRRAHDARIGLRSPRGGGGWALTGKWSRPCPAAMKAQQSRRVPAWLLSPGT
jgi:hypothetical protein